MFNFHDSRNPFYYYHEIQLLVSEYDNYRFVVNSSFDVYGYMYTGNFNPSSPNTNLMSQSIQNAANKGFQLRTYLSESSIHHFVVTSTNPWVTGSFTVVAYGESKVYFANRDDFICSSTQTSKYSCFLKMIFIVQDSLYLYF